MNIQDFLFLLCFFFIIFGFGYSFLRRFVIENGLLFLIPLCTAFSLSTYVILVHVFSFLLGIKNATYLILGIFLILILLINLKCKITTPLEFGLKKNQFIVLIIFSLTFTLLSFFYLTYFDTYDQLYNSIGTISKNNVYPPFHPHNPDTILTYHYGTMLLASSLKIFSKIDIWFTTLPIQIIFIFITPISIFLLLYSISKNFIQSILGTILGCFCANLTSFELLKIPFGQLENPLHSIIWMADGGFADPAQKALVSPNRSVAMALSIILFFLIITLNTQNKKNLFLLFPISAFLFFSYESFWFPATASSVLYHCFLLVTSKEKQSQLKLFFLLILTLSLSAIIVSSVLVNKDSSIISSINFDPKLYVYSWSGLTDKVYSYEWFLNNIITSHGDGATFCKINIFSKYSLIEFGLPVILLPFTLIYILKKRQKQLFFFFIAGLIAFCIPLLITYIPREADTSRFFIYSRFIFGILLGNYFGYLLTIKMPQFLHFVTRFILLIVIPILVIPGIVWLLPVKYGDNDYRYNKISKSDKAALIWLYKKAKPGDRGLGSTSVESHVQLINIAGVYGVNPDPDTTFQFETINTALSILNPCLLKELKVKWIYLNQDLLKNKVPQNRLDELIKDKALVLRYRNSQKQIYEFIPTHCNALNYCKKGEYMWAVGRMLGGRFIPFIQTENNSPLYFTDSKRALLVKNQLVKETKNKIDAFWYRVEAIVH